MSKFEGVADTLYIPLTARIYVSEHFPEYFRDDKAVSLKSEMPYEEIASKSSEYFQMAGACRFYNTDQMVKAFIDRHEKCNIINVGCGLETSYFRIKPDPQKAVFYEMDLPEVIKARRKVLGESENEVLIPGDMFDLAWTENIDKNLPIPTYMNKDRKGQTSGFASAVGKAGADFKRQFTADTYRQFFLKAGYEDVHITMV